MNFSLYIDSRRLLVEGRNLLFAVAFTLLATTAANAGENTGPAPAPMHHPGHGEAAEPAKEHVHVHPQPSTTTDVGLDEHLGASIPLDLTFRDETGRAVTLRELVTVPTIIAPVYYKCPNVCSFLQGGLARALPEVKLEPGKAFRVLSVSFDETETPELAHRSQSIYLDAMRQRFPAAAWSFLTGDPENIRKLLDAAGYHFQRQGEDFLHPVAIFVVASDGKIVRYLHGTSILPMDLTLALVEASEGRIGPTIRRVAQFCFSYDAENRRYVFNLFRVSATVILLTAGAFLAFLILRGRKNPDRPR
jgi:protein SCO1/2